jgi:RNA polymerase sigma-70 factor (ECF subfamily)
MKKYRSVGPELCRWISQNILPHEADVRRWLRHCFRHRFNEDDAIQEAYCRIAGLNDFTHITSGRAYFFTVVRNILLEQVRRERVVSIEILAEIDDSTIIDDRDSPERTLSARQELARVQGLINQLPERCRMVFLMRKVDGLPQREVAQVLGISENIVEKEVAHGLRLLLQMLSQPDGQNRPDARAVLPGPASHESETKH